MFKAIVFRAITFQLVNFDLKKCYIQGPCKVVGAIGGAKRATAKGIQSWGASKKWIYKIYMLKLDDFHSVRQLTHAAWI